MKKKLKLLGVLLMILFFFSAVVSYKTLNNIKNSDSIANAVNLERVYYEINTQGQEQYSSLLDSESQGVDRILTDDELDNKARSSSGIELNGDYTTSNILSIAKRGDVVIQEAGFGGITGHTVIIYEVTITKVVTIEAVKDGVVMSELDSMRFFDRSSTLFSIKGASSTQIEIAMNWAVKQLGRPYSILAGTNYSGSGGIHCALLAYGAYKEAGITLCNTDWFGQITPRGIRDQGMVLRKNVAYKAYSFVNNNSKLAIDVPNSSSSKGVDLIQYQYHGDRNQQFIEVSTKTDRTDYVYIPSYNGHMSIDVDQGFLGLGNGGDNGQSIQLWNSVDLDTSQRSFWWSNGMLRTKISSYQRCVVVKAASNNNSAKLIQYDANGTSNGIWNKTHIASYYFNFY